MWEFLMILWMAPGGNLNPTLAQKCVFLLNFTRILWFSWDPGVMLFDIPKDVVFAEILGFSNIFVFQAVNWTPKCTKTVKFGCIPFDPKCKIRNDFSKTLFLLLETSSGQNFRRSNSICPKKPKKGPIHWCWIDRKNFESF